MNTLPHRIAENIKAHPGKAMRIFSTWSCVSPEKIYLLCDLIHPAAVRRILAAMDPLYVPLPSESVEYRERTLENLYAVAHEFLDLMDTLVPEPPSDTHELHPDPDEILGMRDLFSAKFIHEEISHKAIQENENNNESDEIYLSVDSLARREMLENAIALAREKPEVVAKIISGWLEE